MRRFVNYLRQMFCKHKWIAEESRVSHEKFDGNLKQGVKVYMRCEKCAYHQKHWKYIN
jgi:hypothetical protein